VDDIAAELRISRDAVRHHSKALFRKLGVKSRVGVVLRVVHTKRGH
jgi:DNA-binding NarL/FixJ family response regulator